ncbi:MAG: hypothetical protein IGR93_13755 [Hydrococcus sp. C42_A2020_068]|nr:hypothetical protein [Hydrococcus sp. C42_A2020_068]
MSRLNRKAWKILRAEMEKCTASDRIVGEAWIVTTQKRSIANVEQAKQFISRSQLCHRSVTKNYQSTGASSTWNDGILSIAKELLASARQRQKQLE